jgi:hypothetical protein
LLQPVVAASILCHQESKFKSVGCGVEEWSPICLKINNNQAFYFQASWGRLEIKPHELKNKDKTKMKKKGENKGR